MRYRKQCTSYTGYKRSLILACLVGGQITVPLLVDLEGHVSYLTRPSWVPLQVAPVIPRTALSERCYARYCHFTHCDSLQTRGYGLIQKYNTNYRLVYIITPLKLFSWFDCCSLVYRLYRQKQVKFYLSTTEGRQKIMKKLDYQLNTVGIGALPNSTDMEINFCQHIRE